MTVVLIALALFVAVPMAVGITWLVMRAAEGANYRAERWEHFCVMRRS
jgi:hypothetical protein